MTEGITKMSQGSQQHAADHGADVKTTPVCAACLGAVHFGGEPDFPFHPAADGEPCGAADHEDNVVTPAQAKLVDEISSLELLADMAADLEQTGRVAYCKRRIKKLRAQLGTPSPSIGGVA